MRFCSKRCCQQSRNPRRPRGYFGPLTCMADGCERQAFAYGYCRGHGQRFSKHGDVRADLPLGYRKGGGWITAEGYRMLTIPDHPNANGTGRIAEHRFVMSKVLGRPLAPGETVHHRNGVKTDNRPENLELRAGAHGVGANVLDLVQDAIKTLLRYAPEVIGRSADGELQSY